ncbi:MAG: hypothetical protein K6E46_01420 [Lachnospiraceae bacterium]|nr:hypothetical protein [Lachnospiraceae bacterium]
MIKYLMLLAILLRETVRDIREREIDIGVPIAYGFVAVIYSLIPGRGDILSCAGGVGVGAVVLIIAYIKRESIGIGDGIMLIVTGAALGTYLNLILVIRTALLAGAGAVILIIIRKRRKAAADTMPLMPYILLSYISICVKSV